MLERCPSCLRLTQIGTCNDPNLNPHDRRCIDCWFSPDPEHWVAVASAVLTDGRTGDVVRREFSEDHFWPHDDSPDAWRTNPIPLSELTVSSRTPLPEAVQRILNAVFTPLDDE